MIKLLTHLCRVDYSTAVFGQVHFQLKKVSDLLEYYIPVFNVNSLNHDQTPRSAASDLGLHCLPMSSFWDARHKWV